MGNVWDAEIDISLESALQLIQKTFPDIKAKSIEEFGVGWDNVAFLVDDTFVFRFPRRKCAIPLLQREHLALPILKEHLSASIPNPSYFSTGCEEFPYPFVGYQIIKGKTACSCNLSSSSRVKLAKDIALFLKQLHSIPIEHVSACNLPFDELQRLNARRMISRLKTSLQNTKSLGFVEDIACYDFILDKVYDKKLVQDTIVHGDVYARHLLIDDSRFVGVIDFGDIHIGDKAVDLTIVHSFLPKKSHEVFREEYGYIDAQTWELARLRALYAASILVEYSYDRKDQSLLKESLTTLELLKV